MGRRHCLRERGERLRPGREGAAVQRALDVVCGHFGCIFRRVRSFLQRCHGVLRAMRAATAFLAVLAVLAVGSAAAVALLVSRAAAILINSGCVRLLICVLPARTPRK